MIDDLGVRADLDGRVVTGSGTFNPAPPRHAELEVNVVVRDTAYQVRNWLVTGLTSER